VQIRKERTLYDIAKHHEPYIRDVSSPLFVLATRTLLGRYQTAIDELRAQYGRVDVNRLKSTKALKRFKANIQMIQAHMRHHTHLTDTLETFAQDERFVNQEQLAVAQI
jgi:hypothetical protein